MNARTRKVLEEALELSAKERALLAVELEASLRHGADADGTPEEIEKAWADESERRSQEIDEGRVQAMPAADVHRELRARFRPAR